jgi:hypothetical protein
MVVPLGGVAEGFAGFGLRPSEAVRILLHIVRSDRSVGSQSGSCKARRLKAQGDRQDQPAIGSIDNAKGIAERLFQFE